MNSDNSGLLQYLTETEIDFEKIQDVIYWSKKWEVTPYQLIQAFFVIKTSKVRKIEDYLREKGFAV